MSMFFRDIISFVRIFNANILNLTTILINFIRDSIK